MRLRAQLSNETLSRTQCMTGVSDLKVRKRWRLHLLQGKLWPAYFSFSLSRHLIHRFSYRTTNRQCVLLFKLLKGQAKPSFHSKWQGCVVKSVCFLHNNTRPHTAAMTTGSLEEMH
jgi:hypothetical protein